MEVGTWYLRRRLPDSPPKAAIGAGVAGVVLIGGAALVASQRRAHAH